MPPPIPPAPPRQLTVPRVPVASLSRRAPQAFRLDPDPTRRAALAADLNLSALRKLALAGTLSPEGKHDWRLEGVLGATVVQPCVVSAAPVTTRIDTPVLRRFLADPPLPEAGETESPEDDTEEPLGAVIDLDAVMVEALSLALPDYPRAADLPPDEPARAASVPQAEDRPNPFAALAALKTGGGDTGGTGSS